MSITDELRKYATNDSLHYCSDYLAIADRIDAEHEKELRETGEDIVRDVRREWVRLPLDADNVPIHAGDVMEYADKPTKPLTVSYIELEKNGWWVFAGGMGRRPDKYRHHHAPTVEDVLREMLDAWGELPSNATNEAIIAEYAAKLRLAEGEGA